MKIKHFAIALLASLAIPTTQVIAAPYFYVTGSNTTAGTADHQLSIYLDTDGQTLTAAETILNFENTYLQGKSISILNSRCSFWAPADPVLGYGTNPTPFFHNNNKVVIACGFSSPGFTSTDSIGRLIARVTFTPLQTGTTTLSFNPTRTSYKFIANTVPGGALPGFGLTVTATGSATPNPSATPTPTPQYGCNQSCSVSSQCAGSLYCGLINSVGLCRNVNCPEMDNCICPTPEPTPTPASTPVPSSTNSPSQTLTADDLTFVEIGNNSVSVNEGQDVTLTAIEQDDRIPDPPALEPRPKATPFLLSLLGGGSSNQETQTNNNGEVLAAQSLRELLIPGQSKADKTLVLVNLISTLTFLTLLGIVIWRLITVSRINQLKSKHMKDLLASELASIESKVGSLDSPEGKESFKQNLDEVMKKITGEAKT